MEEVRQARGGPSIADMGKVLAIPKTSFGSTAEALSAHGLLGATGATLRWPTCEPSHAEVKDEQGWLRMHKEWLARGINVGKDRVRKLMKQTRRQGTEQTQIRGDH